MLRFLSIASAAWASLFVLDVAALPTHPVRAAAAVTALSNTELASYAPFTQFARAAYCSPSVVKTWSCGDACNAIPGFQPALTGGDNAALQYYFVGYWPSQKAVVVAHEGTDPTQFLADLTDINIVQTALDTTLFPGVPSNVLAHSGFVQEHAKTAASILATTKSLLAANGASTVITVGHSLGGAVAELDALMFTLNLPSTVHIKSQTYGTPRVGNPAYATFFDSKVSDFKRINHASDPVPIVPGRGLGFQHPHGEIHIQADNSAVSCPGDDDATDSQCTIATVPNIFVGNILDHLGPYEGIFVGTLACT
ncbi:alpha/beta-hydrolase [Trametes versicolor FP-101664 SS1]|uniref:Alpha/beta-hydrolase n=1 Tax=Trametes versicolor (strain FP-101664) TaxID=717944 RepID=R7S6T1_TRAVS|nr:alpha/beta-hydrolase [Trametes versicolor FP-101664 SS1]EIW51601.1 alpha/beta-hydrolase [Trametes versicolor FP-101664 SS1]